MTFEEILYNDDVLDALYSMHFDQCTPIQEQAIPIAEQGRDLIAIAQTGTGKTAAYILPVIDQLADGGFPDNAVNCVIMAPTRELVQQIDRQLQGFAYFVPGISSTAIYGGTDGKVFEQQKRGLTSGASIIIATPGRLLAHLSMGYVDLSKVSFFVLDEADRMLDMGFFDDIMKVVKYLPRERQTLMFSATMPPKIKQLAKQILVDPAEVKIAVAKPAAGIDQSAYVCYETQKEQLLIDIFRKTPPDRVIVFSSSKQKVKQLTRALRQRRFDVAEMHSDLDQNVREQVMLDFKAGRVKVLLATDIVARGIDIDDISLVVNFDVPHEAEDYVHRIGRTARAASTGRAITFISEKEQRKFMAIERLIEAEVPKAAVPVELGDTPRYNSPHGEQSERGRGRNDRGNNKDRRNRKFNRNKPSDRAKTQGDDKLQGNSTPHSGKRRSNHKHGNHQKTNNTDKNSNPQ